MRRSHGPNTNPAFPQRVGQADRQWRFRPDDHQIDLVTRQMTPDAGSSAWIGTL